MASSNKENEKINYCIKLLAGNNVVLVEANNYESEIFVPQIVNGRITFLNIIPNRRCCQGSQGIKLHKSSPMMQTKDTPLNVMGSNGGRKVFRLSAGQVRTMPKPLANSTPAGIKTDSSGIRPRPRSCGSLISPFRGDGSSNLNSFVGGGDSNFPTPEPVRRAIPASEQTINRTLIKMPPGIKILPLYRNSTQGTPKKMGRLVATTPNASQNLTNLSRLNGSFRIPSTPPMSKSFRRNSNTPGGPRAGWHKVITPIRTYTRRCQKPLMVNRPTLVSSAKKSYKTNKVLPSFLHNPTKAPIVSHKVEIKRRRLIIDAKKSISPRTFKKQQLAPLSPAPDLPHRKSLALKTKLPPSASYSSSLPKSRQLLETVRMSAFDLLTNSNRYRCINQKLNEQFRMGCINKASSTYSKYKQLITSIPPLQEDEQIMELSRISLANNGSQQVHQQSYQIMNVDAATYRITLPSNNNIRAPSVNLRGLPGAID